MGVGQVLQHHNARVEDVLALAVDADVVAVGRDLLGVDGQGDGGGGRHVPAVEQELEGQLEVLEDGVGVEEDDELVAAQQLGQHVRLGPRAVVVLDLPRVEELVVVAVDLGWHPCEGRV